MCGIATNLASGYYPLGSFLWVYSLHAKRDIEMSHSKKLDVFERAREKQASRNHDANELNFGRKSREELKKENSHFANLGAQPNYSKIKRFY